jgi:DNA polymerase III subunit chi
MTRIEFYFNVADKQKVLVELIEKAIAKHRQVTILTVDDSMSASVSDYLWQCNQTSFLPNVQPNHLHASKTPVVIGSQSNHSMHDLMLDDMLINLTPAEPIIFSRFTQLVELVGDEEQDRLAARARFKFYRDRGYEIKIIDHDQIRTE